MKTVTISGSLWETTSQASHIAVACVLMMAVKHHFSLHVAVIFLVAALIAAAAKEGWYDYRYESADERGSSLLDFCCYVVGLGIGFFL